MGDLVEPLALTRPELQAVLEKAAAEGARQALAAVGLHDDDAAADVRDLRGLLDAWRSAKATMWQTVLRELTRLALLAIVAGMAIYMWRGGVR